MPVSGQKRLNIRGIYQQVKQRIADLESTQLKNAAKQAEHYFNIGEIARIKENYDGALENYELAIHFDPQNTLYRCCKVCVMLLMVQNSNPPQWQWWHTRFGYKEIVKVCDQILAIDPKDDYALMMKGKVLQHLGQAKQAAEALTAASSLQPRYDDGLNYRHMLQILLATAEIQQTQ